MDGRTDGRTDRDGLMAEIVCVVCVEVSGKCVPFIFVVAGSACYELICYSCHDCYVCLQNWKRVNK